MIHEMADAVLQRKLNTTGVLYLAWVIPFGIFAAAVGLIYLRFLMDLERKTAIRFVVAGAIFVGGAIGMEMAAAPIIETVGPSSIYHTFTQTIEEGMEMTGAILFLRALLLYIAQIHDDILVKTSP